MFQLANAFMRFMAETTVNTDFWTKWGYTDAQAAELGKTYSWVPTVYNAIVNILVPILSIVAAAGIIWAIVLGVQMARADSTEKREEAKKRLIGLVVGIVILVVLIVFFVTLFPEIIRAVISPALNPTTPTTPTT